MHRGSISKLLSSVLFAALLIVTLSATSALADPSIAAAPLPPEYVWVDQGVDYDLIRLSWFISAGGDYWKVYRSATEGGALDFLGNAYGVGYDSAAYDDWTGQQLETYWYYVRACNEGETCGALSAGYQGWVKTVATPGAPTASDGAGSQYVNITWSTSEGADRYGVYRRVAGQGSYELLQLVYDTQYQDESADPCVVYDYALKGCRSNGCGYLSGSDTGWKKLSAPASISASDGTYADKVRVSWSPVPNAINYTVFRGTSSQGYTDEFTGITSNYYDDFTAVPGDPYYYWVYGCCAEGCGALGGYDTGYRAELPPPPTGVQASDGIWYDMVRVIWNASPGATSYEIWRKVNSGSYQFLVDGITSLEYNDMAVSGGNIYWYKIKGCISAGCGDLSAADSGYTLSVPSAPEDVQASDGDFTDRVRVTWSAVASATGYQVWRGTTDDPGAALQLTDTAATSYDDLSVTPGDPFYYWVSASNSAGTGLKGGPDTGFAAEEVTSTPKPTRTSRPSQTPTPTNTRRPSPTASNTPRPWPTATNTRVGRPTATNTLASRPSATFTLSLRPSPTGTVRPTSTWPANPDGLLYLPLVMR